MQITEDLKEPVAGEAQVGLYSCNESRPILSPLQAGSLLNHVGSCSPKVITLAVYTQVALEQPVCLSAPKAVLTPIV